MAPFSCLIVFICAFFYLLLILVEYLPILLVFLKTNLCFVPALYCLFVFYLIDLLLSLLLPS